MIMHTLMPYAVKSVDLPIYKIFSGENINFRFIAAIHRTTGHSRLVFLDGIGNDQVTYTSQLVIHDFILFCKVVLPFSGFSRIFLSVNNMNLTLRRCF